MKTTTIHHVELSHTSNNLSGGEKALIETLRYISLNSNFRQIVYTSESGKILYKKLLGTHGSNISFSTIGSQKLEEFSELLAYLIRVFQQFKLLKKLDSNQTHLIFSHEEFLCSTLFSYLLKRINPHAKWLAFFHMKSPGIFKGFEGEYTGKKNLPSIRIIRYKLEQSLFFFLTKRKVDKVITVNAIYMDYLAGKYKDSYALKKFGGDPLALISKYSGVKDLKSGKNKGKKYDLCFMGRFHAQKGIFELIDIMKRLKAQRPNILLAVIGGGSKPIEEKFFRLVAENDLKDNVHYLGYISGNEKFENLLESKIFVMPSYYESFGQVALEAMKCGLPVIAYDLPPFGVFERGMVKVAILNNSEFAEQIELLLADGELYQQRSMEASSFANTFSWDITGNEILNVIKGMLR